MRQLIVHADDLGLTRAINHGIVHAHQHGVVTSASLMACGGAFEHACELAHAHPTLDVGVHLTFSGERPILSPDQVPSLVDADGRFPPHAYAFLLRRLRRQIDLEDVRRECKAQIETLLARQVRISHIDSHQHLHMLPGMLQVVLDVAAKHGITAVRFPRERIRLVPARGLGSLKRMCELALLQLCCARQRRVSHGRTDGFFGFTVGGRLDTPALLNILRSLPREGTFELMCHPGRDDPQSPYSHWGYAWQAELDALTHPQVRAVLAQQQIQLVSYRDMPHASPVRSGWRSGLAQQPQPVEDHGQ